ncbi:MAG: TonB-dependent receptor [Prevotella sp.]|nr:TonB-dependent receptor [Prevotella sp.]
MKNILFAAALMLAAHVNVAAQQHDHSACDGDSIDPMKEAILNEVTVQGLTGLQRISEAASPYTVISPRELHSMPATNLVDAISHTPGLSQISTGSGISKPVIRGLGYNRVVVVDQGIRQESQQWGDEHGLEVSTEGVHSVEILKGPASLMYGSDAIGGVMILHPERPLDPQTMQVRMGGEYQSCSQLRDYTVGFAGNVKAGSVGNFVWNAHYTDKTADEYRNHADGKVENSWFSERDVQGMLGLQGTWGHTWLRLSNVILTPGIVGEEDAFQRIIHTKVVSDNMWPLLGGQLKATIGYQRNYRREFEEGEAELDMRLNTVNYDLKYTLPTLFTGQEIQIGAGGMWQQNRNHGEEQLIPDYHLFDFGIFLTATHRIGRFNISGGLRYDVRSIGDDHDFSMLDFSVFSATFSSSSLSLGAAYNISDHTNLRLNIARGFRAPTVSELYSNGVHEGSVQYELGNAALKPERNTQIDLGFDHTTHIVSLQASLFLNRISNYIFLQRLAGVVTDGYRTYQYRQGDAILIGGEAGIDVHPWQPLHIQNSFSYVSGRQLHQQADMKWLPMMPAPRWNLTVACQLPDFLRAHLRRTRLTASMEYNLRQSHFLAADDTETATPDYAVVNLSAATDLHLMGHNCIELSVTCQNLFNKVYQSHLSRLKYVDTPDGQGIHAPGRSLCLKARIPIDIHLK